jgi:hypothetical protein
VGKFSQEMAALQQRNGPGNGSSPQGTGRVRFRGHGRSLVSIKPQDVAELVGRIQDAAANQAGTGGVRISLYCRRQTSQQNREFDGIGILIYEQKPMQQGYGNRGGFQGQQRGRTNYPPRQQQAPVRAGYGGYRQGDQPQGSTNSHLHRRTRPRRTTTHRRLPRVDRAHLAKLHRGMHPLLGETVLGRRSQRPHRVRLHLWPLHHKAP